MRFDVVCFGGLNVDKLYKVNRIAKAEEEARILDYIESPGGSAANTAVGLARLGVRTGYVGKVCEGHDGDFLLQALRSQGVDAEGVVVSEIGRCGTVIGFVDEKGDRALYLDPGVSNTLEFCEIKLDYVAVADILHLTSFAGNRPLEAQKKLVEALPNVKVTLDPGMLYAQKGLTELKPLVKRCLVAFPNEHELRLLTGEDHREGAEVLLAEGAQIVAVKLGKKGCYLTDGEESHLVKPFRVKVVDTTGAGDAFCAGFIYGLLKNKTLRECGILGNFVASRVIMKMGARNGLPQREDLPL